MNKNELDEALTELIDLDDLDGLEIAIYAVLKEEGEPKKLNIKADNLSEITELFANSIHNSVINLDDHSVIPLSTADERGKCFYEYDLELPDELAYLNSVIGNDDLDEFAFNQYQLDEIDSLIVVLAKDEKELSLYKKLSPVEVLGRGGYIIWKSQTRFERFKEQLLRISPRFQVLKIGEDIIVTDLTSIERSLGFHDVIKREALAGLEAIEELSIVSNIDALSELIDDVTFARKLTKVAKGSPVIQRGIPNDQIISFSKTHPKIKGKMRYTDDDSQFSLDTNVSKNLFVKLLNDDFLTSELTKLHYESLAKDGVENEEESEEATSDENAVVTEMSAAAE
ncbi:MAG: DUF4868 domain-containing protein [Balneola sp.]|nr:DUF4868 domain-containing protein [Balneola sp.]|tara:strand:+ start:16375 stop:17394 length:1020 start_codon:yes stop_codon:yes gene_type:complete